MKNGNLKISLSFKPIIHFVSRFHTIIFFVILSVALAIAILMLISIVQLSSKSASNALNPVNASFDQQTIDKINQLGQIQPAPTTSKRASPFVE